jgi:hypothetical protein
MAAKLNQSFISPMTFNHDEQLTQESASHLTIFLRNDWYLRP